MKNKYSPEIEKIIRQSKVEALRLGHNCIDTEHFLLSIINEPFSFARKVLISLDVDIEELKELIDDNSLKDKMTNSGLESGELPLNEYAEKALKTMSLETQIHKPEELRSEHLLMAILRYPKCAAAKILNSLDVDYEYYKTEMGYVRHEIVSKYVSKHTNSLRKFGRDLTQYVNQKRHYKTVEREKEIRQIAQILSKKENSSVLLVGEPGVGKRAIIEEFAYRIQNDTRYKKHYNRIIELDWTTLLVDTKYRGVLEERLKTILNDLKDAPKTILLINQIHIAYERMNGNGLNITDIFKPRLEYGELKLIGIIAADKYPALMADRTMNNYFHQLFIHPPPPKQAILMLESAKLKYEAFHNVTYGEGVIKICVQLAHLRGDVLPGKALDLLDEVAAQVRMNNISDTPDSITGLEQEIQSLKEQKTQAVKSEKYEYAADLRDEETKLAQKLKLEEINWLEKLQSIHFTIEKKDVEGLFGNDKTIN